MKDKITANLKEILPRLKEAKLVAVTKYSKVEDIVFAYEAGLHDFGENRVQDLKEKAAYFEEHNLKDVNWHFIGNLQSNKVKDLLEIPHLKYIHSVSSSSLVDELLKRAGVLAEKKIGLFLQFNTSKEDEKSGFETYDELVMAARKLLNHPHYQLTGLMTMGAIRSEDFEKSAHECFGMLFHLKERLENDLEVSGLKLSMGMSADYEIALSHGADFIRIGSAIFK